MSLGNLPSEGQKRNNYPYQYNVVDLLNKIKNALTTGTLIVTGTFVASSTSRTPTRSTETTSGSVTAGAKWASFETSDDFVGTILGVAAQPNRFYEFPPLQNNDYYGAIAYTITSGSIIIGKAV